jgi:hypothetical protein
MEYSIFTPTDAYNQRIDMPPGRAIAGCAIGILVLDVWYPYFPGNVNNASSYNFPVRHKVLKGATVEMIVKGDPALLNMILEAGHELQQEGARALVGACGYFSRYQRQVTAALDIPVFLGSMLQVPMIHMSIKPKQKVGILFGIGSGVTRDMLEACGVTPEIPTVIMGMDDKPEFQNLVEGKGHLTYGRLEQEIVQRAQEMVAQNPDVGAILLECSDMPPFSWAVQDRKSVV